MCPPSPRNFNAIIRDYNNIEVNAGVDASGFILNSLHRPKPDLEHLSIGVQEVIVVDELDCASTTYPLTKYKRTEFTLVEQNDFDTNPSLYVSGSVGLIKQIKEFIVGSGAGAFAKLTTFEYGFNEEPCQPSAIEESSGVV